jgi:hypothetical protein
MSLSEYCVFGVPSMLFLCEVLKKLRRSNGILMLSHVFWCKGHNNQNTQTWKSVSHYDIYLEVALQWLPSEYFLYGTYLGI